MLSLYGRAFRGPWNDAFDKDFAVFPRGGHFANDLLGGWHISLALTLRRPRLAGILTRATTGWGRRGIATIGAWRSLRATTLTGWHLLRIKTGWRLLLGTASWRRLVVSLLWKTIIGLGAWRGILIGFRPVGDRRWGGGFETIPVSLKDGIGVDAVAFGLLGAIRG